MIGLASGDFTSQFRFMVKNIIIYYINNALIISLITKFDYRYYYATNTDASRRFSKKPDKSIIISSLYFLYDFKVFLARSTQCHASLILHITHSAIPEKLRYTCFIYRRWQNESHNW